MTQLVKTNINETIFEIILNRPDKRNAISLDLYEQFGQAVAQADKTQGIRAVVIRGEGKAFSAGIDVTAFLQLAQDYGGDFWKQRMRTITDNFQATLTRLERLEVPTIAVLHGYCLGLAMELALACDIRLAAEGTQMGLPETRLGMIPDVGGTTRLTRLIGPSRAKEIIFTGGRYDVAQLEKWGVVNYVLPPNQLQTKVTYIINQIVKSAPLAVGMAKRVVDGLADVDRGLMLEGWAQSQLFQTSDFQEGIEAFMMRREPKFTGN